MLTLTTTGIRFIKGFVVMKYLNLTDLGIITLIAATMGLFSFFQIGFLNGGYRIYCEEHKDKIHVNEIIYTYLFFIEVLIIVGILFFFSLERLSGIELFYAITASFMGMILVFNNWVRNILIAERRVTEVNKLEVSSTLISLSFLFTVPIWGVYGAILVTFSIEIFFYVFAIIRNPYLLPKRLNFEIAKYRWVLSFGFLPFISGIILSLSTQIETWSIAGFISTQALGAFYLPRLYVQLFQLVPGAVAKLFTPPVVKSYANSDYAKMKQNLKYYFLVNAFTCLLSVLITYLFLDFVIETFVPLHKVGISLVWIIIPGLIIYTLLQPFDLILYAAVVLKPFLWVSLISVSIVAILLVGSGFFKLISLEFVAMVKVVFFIVYSMGILFYCFYFKKLILIK